jgi:hypothetical protein
VFGSWNAAIVAAGFIARRQGNHSPALSPGQFCLMVEMIGAIALSGVLVWA